MCNFHELVPLKHCIMVRIRKDATNEALFPISPLLHRAESVVVAQEPQPRCSAFGEIADVPRSSQRTCATSISLSLKSTASWPRIGGNKRGDFARQPLALQDRINYCCPKKLSQDAVLLVKSLIFHAAAKGHALLPRACPPRALHRG